MSKRILTTLASITIAVSLSGCLVHEQQPYAPVYAQTSYPLYYGDGVYWAYSDASWYWWSNDHWEMSTYVPHSAVLITPNHGYYGGHYSGGHGVTSHGGSHHTSSGHHGGGHH